jgi:hypothetical protein
MELVTSIEELNVTITAPPGSVIRLKRRNHLTESLNSIFRGVPRRSCIQPEPKYKLAACLPL